MGVSSRFGPSRRGRVARVLLWQPENERQVWLYALWYGVITGAAYGLTTYLVHGPASHWWAIGSLIFASVGVVVSGLVQRYRLRNRQDARARADWADH
jgi:hypothetical protein